MSSTVVSGQHMARQQRRWVAVLVVLALLWLALWWRSAPVLAVLGVGALAFGHYGVFVWQLCMLRRLCVPGDPLRPSWFQVLHAAFNETWVSLKVFAWGIPFRAGATSAQWQDDLSGPHVVAGRRGVLLLHGFICNRGMWGSWPSLLRARGHPLRALTLEPVFGSIDDYAQAIDQAVSELTQATGQPPLLLCHSMGGLAARAWLRREKAGARVWRVVTLGTPHHGTWLGHMARTQNGRQMALDSAWLKQLAQDEIAAQPLLYQRFTCWYAQCDNIVFPVTSATLLGADNRLVSGAVAHLQLAFMPQVRDHVLGLLEQGKTDLQDTQEA